MLGLDGRSARTTFFLWSLVPIALIVIFPALYMGLHRSVLRASSCGTDSCGAVGLIFAMMFKPIALLAIVALFIWPVMRRARDAGLPAWLGLAVPLLVAIDFPIFMMAGGPWSLAFTMGRTGGHLLPIGSIAALVFLILLMLPASRPARDWQSQPTDRFEKIAGWSLSVVGLSKAAALSSLWLLSLLPVSMMKVILLPLGIVAIVELLAELVFLGVTAFLLIRQAIRKPAIA